MPTYVPMARQPSTTDAEPFIANLRKLSELALQRHYAMREQFPKRSTAPYLRAALAYARELLKHVTFHPTLRADAQTIVEQVIAATQAAEEACFEAGGNSAPYISVLVAAEGLRLNFADAPIADLKKQLGSEFSLFRYEPGFVDHSPYAPRSPLAPPPDPLPSAAGEGEQPRPQGA